MPARLFQHERLRTTISVDSKAKQQHVHGDGSTDVYVRGAAKNVNDLYVTIKALQVYFLTSIHYVN